MCYRSESRLGCQTRHICKRFSHFKNIMKSLNEALNELKKTSPILKPRLCLNESTGMYLVTLAFSKQYCESQGLKVIL